MAKSKKDIDFKKQLVDEMLRLSTSAFGLVAALAWNDLVKETIAQYVTPFVSKDSGVISLAVYAIIVTILAVAVTYSLAKIKGRF